MSEVFKMGELNMIFFEKATLKIFFKTQLNNTKVIVSSQSNILCVWTKKSFLVKNYCPNIKKREGFSVHVHLKFIRQRTIT